MKTPLTASAIISAFADYITRNPRRFPNPPAALNVLGNAAESWERDTGADPAKLPRYFTTRPDGRFDLPPLNKLTR